MGTSSESRRAKNPQRPRYIWGLLAAVTAVVLVVGYLAIGAQIVPGKAPVPTADRLPST